MFLEVDKAHAIVITKSNSSAFDDGTLPPTKPLLTTTFHLIHESTSTAYRKKLRNIK
jgi:hypothetical protein